MLQFDRDWLDEKTLQIASEITSCKAIDTEGTSYPGKLHTELRDNHIVHVIGSWHCEDVAGNTGIIRLEMFDQKGRRVGVDEKSEPVHLVNDMGIYTSGRFRLKHTLLEETDG